MGLRMERVGRIEEGEKALCVENFLLPPLGELDSFACVCLGPITSHNNTQNTYCWPQWVLKMYD